MSFRGSELSGAQEGLAAEQRGQRGGELDRIHRKGHRRVRTAPRGQPGVLGPPVLVLIGRPQDAWLATWSRADAAVTLPVDPVEFASALASLLRRKALLGA